MIPPHACASEPSSCASASNGFTIVPASSTHTRRSVTISPVSRSTRTTTSTAPALQTSPSGLKKCVASSPGSTPGGNTPQRYATSATAGHGARPPPPAECRGLTEERHPAADALPALPALAPLRAQLLVVGPLHQRVEQQLVVAGVVALARGRGDRNLPRRDRVASPDLDRVG